MALYIQTNIASLDAQRALSTNQSKLNVTFQRLSSGYRINTAADDAAGLAISENMRAQIRSYSAAERNTNSAISMAQTAEGALGQISSILIRLRELAVQSANGELSSSDRGYLDIEFTQLKNEIDRIVNSTTFNNTALLSGTSTTIDFQVGIANTTSDRISVNFGGVDLSSLGLSASTVVGSTAANSQAAISAIDAAIAAVSTKRADFGATMNRLEVAVANTQSMRSNLTAANSRIRDVDVAEETAMMAKLQVLSQAGAAVLAQANQLPQVALGLLK
jgi:flagellin